MRAEAVGATEAVASGRAVHDPSPGWAAVPGVGYPRRDGVLGARRGAPQVRRAALARLEGAAVAAYAYRAADMIAAARAADQAEAATLLGRVLEEGQQAPWPRRRGAPPVRCGWLFDDGPACGARAVRGGYLCRSRGGTPVARHSL